MISKNIDITDNINLTILKASPLNNDYPLATQSIIIYIIEKDPPVKSNMTLWRDQPTVLFLFQLR